LLFIVCFSSWIMSINEFSSYTLSVNKAFKFGVFMESHTSRVLDFKSSDILLVKKIASIFS
jgi:hypothetical protein